MKDDTVKKLKNELEEAKKSTDPKARAVAEAVHSAITVFCGEEPEFEQAVAQSDKNLRQVCEACVKGVGGSISDLEVYRRAVGEYFPGAQVDFMMTIRMSEHENPSRDPETPKSRTSGDVLSLDLFDLMGG